GRRRELRPRPIRPTPPAESWAGSATSRRPRPPPPPHSRSRARQARPRRQPWLRLYRTPPAQSPDRAGVGSWRRPSRRAPPCPPFGCSLAVLRLRAGAHQLPEERHDSHVVGVCRDPLLGEEEV